MNSYSKKGMSLVELIVALSLMSVFAVLCVMLVNPIERTYRSTLKLARAQLLADTLVDSIRKEVDDVKHDDTTDVWIANLSGSDDRQLINDTPLENKKSSGNALVFRRNNNYTEAIYAAVGISKDNQDAVAANTLTPDKTAHSIDTLINSGKENLDPGIVHFGYYQAKEDDNGVFPIQPYDYTNPVMAKTYGDFTVTLNFSDLTLKSSKYPAYVMCKVTVLSNGKELYSRSAVLCFAANGSGKGSGSHHTNPPSVRDIEVNIVWNDKSATDKRPENGLTFTLRDNNSTVLGTHTESDVRSLDTQRFVFKNINTKNGFGLAIVPDKIAEYERTITKTANGYLVKYTRTAEVRLIKGPIFKTHVTGKGITSFVFANSNDNTVKTNIASATPIPVAERKKADGTYETVDDYKLYIVPFADGSKVAYIVSDSGTFNGNPDMSCMFEGCSDATQFTGLELIDTTVTVDMHRMFKNCRKWTNANNYISMRTWNTSNVKAFDSMFYNVASDDSITENITIDVRNFDFSNAQYHLSNGGDGKEVIGINKMFYTDYGKQGLPNYTGHVGRIIFNENHKEMSKLNMVQEVFAGCDNLTSLENFNDIDFSGVKYFSSAFASCPKVETLDFSKWTLTNENFTSVSEIFSGLSGLKHFKINNLNIPNVTSVTGLFSKLSALETVQVNNLTATSATSINTWFKDRKLLTSVQMSGLKLKPNTEWTAQYLFYNCTSLKEVDVTGLVNGYCTDILEMFRNCNSLGSIKGLKSWNTSAITDFSRLFYGCNSNGTGDEFVIDISGFTFNQSDNVDITMASMFYSCGATKIKFPASFNPVRVKYISGLFQNCNRLSEVENFILSTDEPTDAEAPVISFPNVTSVSNLFTYCSGFKNVKMNLDMPNCSSIGNLFSNCNNLVSADLSGSDLSKLDNAHQMFYSCSALTKVILNNVNMSSFTGNYVNSQGITSVTIPFDGCSNLTHLEMRSIVLTSVPNLSNFVRNSIKHFDMSGATVTGITSLVELFASKTNLNYVDISNVTWGYYTSAYRMFKGCENLQTLNVSGFNAPSNCKEMFMNCKNTKQFNLNGMNTVAVEYMDDMFDGCINLEGFDSTAWTGWTTENVKSMNKMFYNVAYHQNEVITEGLYDINISNFDFSKVTDFTSMFDVGTKNTDENKDLIKKIILPSNTTGNPQALEAKTTTYMFRRRTNVKVIENVEWFETDDSLKQARGMFSRSGVEILDIRRINLLTLENSDNGSAYIFDNCASIKTIIVASGTNCNISSFKGTGMFSNCKKLVGGNGTAYATICVTDTQSNNFQNRKYALVDGLNGNKGYFTSPEQWEAAGH